MSVHSRLPEVLHWSVVEAAREAMRQGKTLAEAAIRLNVHQRDLDLSLWRQLGGGWKWQ